MKIAMTDMDIIWENKPQNQEQCKKMIREASEHRADIILFPEMTLTGFSMNVEKIQDKDGETISFFSEQARQFHIAVGFGYVTCQGTKGRNHFCFVDHNGKVLADYEKIHPFTYGGETMVYEGGAKICHFTFDGFNCGIFICYDLRFPEAFQQLPEATDAVFLIANWPESRLDHWYTLLKARAIEMQCYIVGVNRTGKGGGLQYAESSAAFAPDGRRLDESRGKHSRYIECDRGERLAYIENFPTRKDRRPDIYFA